VLLRLVDRHDGLGGLHPGPVLDRTGDAAGDIQLEASGSTADILGDPWRALPAVVRMADRYRHPLAAGSVLLAGAATAAIPLQRGTT